MIKAALLAFSARLICVTQMLSMLFSSLLKKFRCAKFCDKNELYPYKSRAYKIFAVLNVLSGPVLLCSLVILCPPMAGTGCSGIAQIPPSNPI
jgi:hypothetical protein